jgi:hypothetical protein
LGVITRVGLRVRRLPEHRIYDALVLPGFAAGVEAFRDAAQSRATADVMRLSDEAETATTLLMSGPSGLAGAALARYLRVRGVDISTAALAIVGWEGTDRDLVRARRAATWKALRRHGAVSLGHGPGESWRRHRFDGPHLRDALMDSGYLVETLETATHWSGYLELHADVTAALREALATLWRSRSDRWSEERQAAWASGAPAAAAVAVSEPVVVRPEVREEVDEAPIKTTRHHRKQEPSIPEAAVVETGMVIPALLAAMRVVLEL